MEGDEGRHVTICTHEDSASRSPPRARPAVPPGATMLDIEADGGQGSGQGAGMHSGSAQPAPDHLATIAAQLALLPAIQPGQTQLATDLSSLFPSLDKQKEATATLASA